MFDSVVGCDMSDEHPGKFIFDRCFTVPRCSSESYYPTLKNIITEFNIDITIPIAEPELRQNAERGVEKQILETALISANLKSMKVGFDKLYTANFLEENGLPFPKTKIVSEVDQAIFPLILKDRKGSGSKSIFLVSDQSEFDFYARRFPNFIAQEFVPNSLEEYTCGLFRSSTGEIRSITFKRKLIGGFSGFGMVVFNDSINKVLIAIAEKLELLGSINVQLRLSDRGPIVFEINPRFSSTVMFRHLMGFEDVIWSIQDRLGLPISDYRKPDAGKRFYKGFNEYID